MIPHTLSPPPSPYTTLFRSDGTVPGGRHPDEHPHGSPRPRPPCPHALRAAPGTAALSRGNVVFRSPQRKLRAPSRGRSEEHTSELQSRENLVCRLLLEKKNK